MKNTFLILILVFVFGGFAKSTANEIFIADTTLSRLYPAEISVQGSLDNSADSVKIILKYDATQLNIIGVFSGKNNIFMDSILSFERKGTNYENSELHITCKNINPNGKFFCNIRLQALINQDTIFRLEPVKLEINGIEETSHFVAGNFLVKNPIFETKKSEIGYPFPNPFERVTTLEYFLFEDAYIDITVYDAFGRTVKSINGNYDSEEFYFYDSEKQPTLFNSGVKSKAGRYYMDWYPSKNIWASVAYYIVFNIGGEIYTTNVIMAR
jgi:hypothetical protein